MDGMDVPVPLDPGRLVMFSGYDDSKMSPEHLDLLYLLIALPLLLIVLVLYVQLCLHARHCGMKPKPKHQPLLCPGRASGTTETSPLLAV
jgi:hypothetical protein